jgi:glycoprotein endo-alpha-1,2-mannosidase
MHWDHEVLAHWDPNIRTDFPSGRLYFPPKEIGSSYFPKRGLYSSKDPSILKAQFYEIAEAGIGVVILSWWRKGWGSEQVRIRIFVKAQLVNHPSDPYP